MRMPLLRRRRQPRPSGSALTQPRPSGSGYRNRTDAVAANRNRISRGCRPSMGRRLVARSCGGEGWRRRRSTVRSPPTVSTRCSRRVYSDVPPSLLSVEGWHAAAVLCGGEGACLCAASAAWWTELVKERPAVDPRGGPGRPRHPWPASAGTGYDLGRRRAAEAQPHADHASRPHPARSSRLPQ